MPSFFFLKNLYSWGKCNLKTGKGFIFSDKEEFLKESAAKIPSLSHKVIFEAKHISITYYT